MAKGKTTNPEKDNKTSSFVLELGLRVSKEEVELIEKKMRIARSVYNACLRECLKRMHALRENATYRQALDLKKTISDDEVFLKEINNLLSKIRLMYGFSEYQMHDWVVSCKRHFEYEVPKKKEGVKMVSPLGIGEIQKLATRAFFAVSKILYGQAKKVHFKSRYDDMSIENKANSFGLRYNVKKRVVIWGDLCLHVIRKNGDTYAKEALKNRVKYIRLIKREIRGRIRYFVQFVLEGTPPVKRRRDPSTKGERVALDIGPSSVAIYSDDGEVRLLELAPGCTESAKKLNRLNRAMDRSRRATNPNNYNPDGTIPKGKKEWVRLNNYEKLKSKRKEEYRKMAAKRKQSHEELANEILAKGDDVRVETMNWRSLQKRSKETTKNKKNGRTNSKKRFGGSIAIHAPGTLIEAVRRKLAYEGKDLREIDTRSVRASQFNHADGTYTKKSLDERWNDIRGKPIQRDMYSAFLIANTTDDLKSVDVERCHERWEKFVIAHDLEIERIKTENIKALRWFIA